MQQATRRQIAPQPENSIVSRILLFALTRLVLNSAYRMVYPLLPVFARGLRVDAAAVGRALTLRSIAGACSPAIGSVSDSIGRRAGMVLGLLLFSAGAALVWLFPTFTVFVLALSLMVVGKYVYEPSIQAYLGERVPYSRRGLTIAATELGWSLAFIAGVPACAFAIGRFGWAAPLPAFTLLGLIAAALHWRTIEPQSLQIRGLASWHINLRAIITSPPAFFGLTAALFATVANEVVNVVFGIWMEGEFRVSLGGLGAAAVIVGAAELCGEVLAGLASDRLGKRRSVMLGLGLNSLAAVSMLLSGGSLAGALARLFFFFLTFEFGIVSLTPLMTELFPGARATLMGVNEAAFGLGRALGALIAIPL